MEWALLFVQCVPGAFCVYIRWKVVPIDAALGSWSIRIACARIWVALCSRSPSASVLSVASGTEFQIRKESLVATSKLVSLRDVPSIVWPSSGSAMNEGDARNAYRIASATSLPVWVGVSVLKRMRLVTSVVVSGRRNALRPKLMTVFCKQVVPAVPAAVGSQVMYFALAVALAMT